MPSNKEKGQKMCFCIHLNGVCLCASHTLTLSFSPSAALLWNIPLHTSPRESVNTPSPSNLQKQIYVLTIKPSLRVLPIPALHMFAGLIILYHLLLLKVPVYSVPLGNR